VSFKVVEPPNNSRPGRDLVAKEMLLYPIIADLSLSRVRVIYSRKVTPGYIEYKFE